MESNLGDNPQTPPERLGLSGLSAIFGAIPHAGLPPAPRSTKMGIPQGAKPLWRGLGVPPNSLPIPLGLGGVRGLKEAFSALS